MATTQDLYEQLGAVGQSWVPLHVTARMAVLTQGEAVVYADYAMRTTQQGVNGTAVALTDSRVVLAQFDQSPEDGQAVEEREGSSTVEVRCWSRALLRGVRIGTGENATNQDLAWYTDLDGRWPRTGRLDLHYEGRDQALRLPLSTRRAARGQVGMDAYVDEVFTQVLPTLLADLAPKQDRQQP